jgi:hypothetical protein
MPHYIDTLLIFLSSSSIGFSLFRFSPFSLSPLHIIHRMSDISDFIDFPPPHLHYGLPFTDFTPCEQRAHCAKAHARVRAAMRGARAHCASTRLHCHAI